VHLLIGRQLSHLFCANSGFLVASVGILFFAQLLPSQGARKIAHKYCSKSKHVVKGRWKDNKFGLGDVFLWAI
jgi:hypothetical protein